MNPKENSQPQYQDSCSSVTGNHDTLRIHLNIEGIVQGVGFRPFLHRLARRFDIRGWVRNTSSGLEGSLEGAPDSLEHFLEELGTSPPPMAVIDRIDTKQEWDGTHFRDFVILKSHENSGHTLVSPDIAVCPECRRELADPSDRRYRYPFINCTNCGPRYTIIRSLPYDRPRTVMDEFTMCEDCEKEYHDINDRRYHAQPDCCPKCGPEIFFIESSKSETAELQNELQTNLQIEADSTSFPQCPKGEGALQAAQQLLASGGILAVKGIGGIHLACDARNASAVQRLRRRKNRAGKPLAVMARCTDTVRKICRLSAAEERILTSPAHPIVLLSKQNRDLLPDLSFSARLGVMLPYTPLHILLVDGIYGGPDLLVMTSGNVKGCPVITENEEALRSLKGVADGFLLHNRKIQNRCDDSLVTEWKGQPWFLRRSRGYAPAPVRLNLPSSHSAEKAENADGIFAMGAEQKASFALGRDDEIFLSPHIGDLKNAETFSHYTGALQTYTDLFRLKPSLYVCDLHPDYLSSREAVRRAEKTQVPLIRVQHHWAHMASCMADNQLDTPCFGIIWDGTGLGADGSIWGGEFLKGDYETFTRVGSIRPVPLIGGDRAVQEIGRIALAMAADTEAESCFHIPLPEEKCRMLLPLLDSPLSPKASSIGRLFDGVCSLITGRAEADYEGEGAALLESLSPVETPDELASPLADFIYPIHFYDENSPEKGILRIFDTRPVVSGILRDLETHAADGISPDPKRNTDNRESGPADQINGTNGSIALRFMCTLCQMALEQCIALNPEKLPVVLSGGVFQNRFLLSGISALLRENGFTVYTHRQVSTNDEGLCLGQLAIARKQRIPAEKERRNYYVSGYANENQNDQRTFRRV